MEQHCCANGTSDEPEVVHVNPISDIERFIIATLLTIAGALGLTGNTLVIIAVILFKKLRSSTNVFVVNLCVADWITCSNMPWMVLGIVNTKPEWPLPDWICVSCGFMAISCIGCSTFTLAFIALNRLIMITSHAKFYPIVFTHRNMFFMVLLTWIIPISLATLPLVSKFGKLGYDYRYQTCTWDSSNPYSSAYSMLLSVVLMPVQFLIIISCYFKIYLYILGHSRRLHPAEASDNQSTHAPTSFRLDVSTVASSTNGLAHSSTEATAEPTALRKALTKRQVQVTKNMFYVVCGFVICLYAIWTKPYDKS